MQGPEWNVTGNLRDWDVTGRLGEIRQRTLVTSGAYDEMAVPLVAMMVSGLPNATHVLFEQSAHMAHIEEEDRYIATVAAFLDGADPCLP